MAPWKYKPAERSDVIESVDNTWIVSCVPISSKTFHCQSHIEMCFSRSGGIKYIFQHAFKWSDLNAVQTRKGQTRRYEVFAFEEARDISSCKTISSWFQLDNSDRYPNVARLDGNLEKYYTVYFREGSE